jgi:hypothetical protein
MSRACVIDWRQAIRQQAIRRSDELFVSVLHHRAHVIREPNVREGRGKYAWDLRMSTRTSFKIATASENVGYASRFDGGQGAPAIPLSGIHIGDSYRGLSGKLFSF